jgi:AraC-like DNA-binding protein
MKPVPLIRAGALRPLFEFLERSGAPADAEIELARLRLGHSLSLIPLTVGGAIWAAAARATGWDDLGLRVGATAHVEDAGALGVLVREAPSVGAALETAVCRAEHFNSGERFWLTQRADEVWLHHRYSSALREGRRQGIEFVLMLWIGLIRLAAGAEWRPTCIRMEGAAPRHREALAALAQDGVRFGQPDMALALPRSVLALPLPALRSARAAAREAHVAAALASFPEPDFAGSARQAVASLLRLGSPDIAATARAAGTSVRSLQRHLAEAHLSFVQLLEEARCDAARSMLRDPCTKIIEISAELGYTDSANFTRAFRRWTGLSPRAYRRSVVGRELTHEIGHLRPGAGRELAERSL